MLTRVTRGVKDGKTLLFICSCLTHHRDTPNGADASTLIYSIIQTAVANELIPQKYLEFLFESIKSGMDVSTLVLWSEEVPDKCRKRKIPA